jgi:predicted ATPase
MLKRITLLRDRVADWNCYQFTVAPIRELTELEFRSRICFFVGENGTGKSTLLEAIAAHPAAERRKMVAHGVSRIRVNLRRPLGPRRGPTTNSRRF